MSRKYLAILIVGLVLIISAIIYLMQNKSVASSLKLTSIPSASTLSKPTAILTDSYQGTIISFNNSLVVMNTGSAVKSFNISQTTDIQGVTYGSLELGNAVTTQGGRSDLLAGKQVFVVTLKDSNIVKSIYIFR